MESMRYSKFYFGVDYYPEHWPEERWLEDVKLMKAAGFNIVRLAEFAWAKMEVREGQFDFDWLDRSIEILANHGIQVVLGTPTASPPPWLMAKQRDLFRVDAHGNRLTYGNRRGYCPNHPLYHQHSHQIASKMAEHFAGKKSVIGWQIDNELGSRCYCDICRDRFHKWLQKRYQVLDTLNNKWGTVFWSHIYTDWSQIPVPLKLPLPANTGFGQNPGLHLDYNRFMSDSYRAYQKLQIDAIRRYTSEQFITHNLMGFKYDELNYYDNTEDLDFVSWDNYWRTQWNMESALEPSSAALSADTMRGLKKKNFWVMEQQSGGGGWDTVAITPKPGQLRLWAYQTIAHGADAILFFRWRTCCTGTEQNWQGVLDHHGKPGRRYDEVVQMGSELEKIGRLLLGAQNTPQVAIMQSYDTRFAFQIQPNNPRFDYKQHIQDIYRGFFRANIQVDIVSEKASLDDYKLVFVPAMYVLSEETASNLEQYAKSGGVVVFSPRTGVKDDSNTVVSKKLPGLVSQMAGVEVEEYISMPIDEDSEVQFTLPDLETLFTSSVWADVLKPTTAQVVAHFTEDYYADQAAATINAFGDGKVIYLGTMGDDAYYEAIVRTLSGLAGVKSLLNTPNGVEVVERWQGDQRLIFVLNHNDTVHHIEFDTQYVNLLSNEIVDGSATIAPWEVLILTATA